jgi:truncated hemoglobin YjbI
MKKRVTNLEHLIIAKKNNLIFVTGDKEIIRKCKRFYEKILDYRTLRKIYKNTNNLNSKKEG